MIFKQEFNEYFISISYFLKSFNNNDNNDNYDII